MLRDAPFDRHISAVESGDWTLCPCRGCDNSAHDEAVEAGLLDQDQPTLWSHRMEVERMTAPLSKDELWMLRSRLALNESPGEEAK